MPFRSSSIQSKILDVQGSNSPSTSTIPSSIATPKDNTEGLPTSTTKTEYGLLPRWQGPENEGTGRLRVVLMVLVKLGVSVVAGVLLWMLVRWFGRLWG